MDEPEENKTLSGPAKIVNQAKIEKPTRTSAEPL